MEDDDDDSRAFVHLRSGSDPLDFIRSEQDRHQPSRQTWPILLCGVTYHDWLDRRGRLTGPYDCLSSLIKKPSAEHPAEKLRSCRVDLVQVVTLAGSRAERLHDTLVAVPQLLRHQPLGLGAAGPADW